jgi:hypothetical protein
MVHGYEDRLVAYVDILGWQDASNRLEPGKLIEALNLIHEEPRSFNEAGRRRIVELGKRPDVLINRGYLKIRAAAFSDNIAVSHPKSFGTRIFSIRRICLGLLHLGFLTRGGITVGQLYHEDNMIFGPALNRAHEIESREAVFPRIVCDHALIELLEKDPAFEQEVIQDHLDGKHVINLYPPAFAKAPAYVWQQFFDNHYKFSNTLETIENNIELLAGDAAKLNKWEYMRDYVQTAKQRLVHFIGEDLPHGY